ncbi:trypanothione synthetase [Angomonas deanei]|nr:trypanothione synthetase [Angomonas deanei]|eukprot:EPY38174.1 trypanothione synthetase [Angomonas deanei]
MSQTGATFVEAHKVCGYTVEGVAAFSNGHSNRWKAEKNYEDGLYMGYKWQCVEFARRWLWKSKGLYLQERNCAYGYHKHKHVYRPKPAEGGGWTDKSEWEKVPCAYVRQGSRNPPRPHSLIIYPMSWGSPYGHIGVITDVDLSQNLVFVADQNRYFHDWGEKTYSAAFPLHFEKERYYIGDHESTCKGWIEFEF